MRVIVDNLVTEYLDQGNAKTAVSGSPNSSQGEEFRGPTILMLHGWGNTLHYFDPLCQELTGFRIVRLDAPGFGGTETPKVPWSMEEYARFVAAFCNKLNLKPTVLLGHSFGGRIIIKGVSEHILAAEKIVLIAAAGVAGRFSARNIFYAIISKIGKYVLKPLSRDLYQRMRREIYKRSKSDYLETGAMSETFLNIIRENLSRSAAHVTVPALIIWGQEDEITPLHEAERLHYFIKASELKVIAGAGHFVYREKPEEVARLIRDFV
jgi:pimeloyl-ACP methyl ester carboxylesterase